MPPLPVPVHCAVPPAPVQLAVYVVDCDGDTEVLPEVGEPLPVEKLLPVQEVAFVDAHERVEDWPCAMLVGFKESVHTGGKYVIVVVVDMQLFVSLDSTIFLPTSVQK